METIRHYDILIVGAGWYGAVWAHEAAEKGKRVLVIDRRDHIAGNCFDANQGGILVHKYGPHIFHTGDARLWEWVGRFGTWNNFSLRTKVRFGERLYSFPINLMTLHQLWGVVTPQQAKERLDAERVRIARPANLEEWALSEVGTTIYETFIRGYTEKQWGRPCRELPSSIVRRLPIRLTLSDRYFPDNHRFEGVPENGYTAFFDRVLDHPNIEVRLRADYLSDRAALDQIASFVVYSGPLDALFGYDAGRLEYRSLRFEEETLPGDFQGAPVVNYTQAHVPWTRITEHKHFYPETAGQFAHTVITREYPQPFLPGAEPYYPVRDAAGSALSEVYLARAKAEMPRLHIGGRLGRHVYVDMHQALASALTDSKRFLV